MIPWSHPSPRPKRHLERFSRSCTAHGCDPQTDTQMHRPRYICSNRPHLARLLRCGLISRPTAELTKSLSYEHKQLSVATRRKKRHLLDVAKLQRHSAGRGDLSSIPHYTTRKLSYRRGRATGHTTYLREKLHLKLANDLGGYILETSLMTHFDRYNYSLSSQRKPK